MNDVEKVWSGPNVWGEKFLFKHGSNSLRAPEGFLTGLTAHFMHSVWFFFYFVLTTKISIFTGILPLSKLKQIVGQSLDKWGKNIKVEHCVHDDLESNFKEEEGNDVNCWPPVFVCMFSNLKCIVVVGLPPPVQSLVTIAHTALIWNKKV